MEFNPESEFHLDFSYYKLKNRIIEQTQFFCEIHKYNTRDQVLQTETFSIFTSKVSEHFHVQIDDQIAEMHKC